MEHGPVRRRRGRSGSPGKRSSILRGEKGCQGDRLRAIRAGTRSRRVPRHISNRQNILRSTTVCCSRKVRVQGLGTPRRRLEAEAPDYHWRRGHLPQGRHAHGDRMGELYQGPQPAVRTPQCAGVKQTVAAIQPTGQHGGGLHARHRHGTCRQVSHDDAVPGALQRGRAERAHQGGAGDTAGLRGFGRDD